MIKGTYIFYDGDNEVYRSKNILTKFGKRHLTNLIAGNIVGVNKDIVIGIDNTTATENDTRLGFEFYKVPVILRSTDIQQTGVDGLGNPTFSYSVVFKATLPQDVSGIIKEIGLYPSDRVGLNNFDSKFISDFSNPVNWKNVSGSSGMMVTENARIGDFLISMSSREDLYDEYKTDISLDLSGYSINDALTLAYRENDTDLDYIQIRFYSSDTSYYYAEITSDAVGDRLVEIPMSTVFTNAINSPDKNNITKIGIRVVPVSGTSTVSFDGIRINDEDTFDPEYGLISRSVLGEALTKLTGRQVDIEYKLDLSF